MKKGLFIMAVAALLASPVYADTPAAAPSLSPDITPDMAVYTKAQADKMKPRQYKYHASAKQVSEAVAELKCQVGEDLVIALCAVLSETPPGHGFGKNAAVTVLLYGRSSEGGQPGAWMKVTSHFKPE
jgi:hypothetical protein